MTDNKIIVVGKLSNHNYLYNGLVISLEGIARSICSRDYKGSHKVLVIKDNDKLYKNNR